MKWIPALIFGAIIGCVLPMMFGGRGGLWTSSWTNWGTVHPFAGSPGLIFSIPLFIGVAIAFRLFFSWHRN
ncbi:MAG: hypothetical protein ABIR87_03680 [Sphingomicrobium sp.]